MPVSDRNRRNSISTVYGNEPEKKVEFTVESEEWQFIIAALLLERLCLIFFCSATIAVSVAFFIYGYMLQAVFVETA